MSLLFNGRDYQMVKAVCPTKNENWYIHYSYKKETVQGFKIGSLMSDKRINDMMMRTVCFVSCK